MITIFSTFLFAQKLPEGFPKLTNEFLLQRLEPTEGKIQMVLDTDTYNEIDDQFAVVYSLLSNQKLKVEAIYAAPFFNKRSEGPEDGMEKSYQEILRLLKRLDISPDGFVFRGSAGFLKSYDLPFRSEAALDLVKRAKETVDKPLYVVPVGAPTNIASAILIEPEIIKNIVIVWLGGTADYWHSASEFNLRQDLLASQLLFNCGVPFVRIPTWPVTSHLHTTLPEIEKHVKGQGAIGNYLAQIYKEYRSGYAQSKVIWDISAVAYLINPSWVPTQITHSPILTDQVTYSFNKSRHFMKTAVSINRDKIFGDLFMKLKRNTK
jgi:inosine-uridine nucleoside N-ribohydrolase